VLRKATVHWLGDRNGSVHAPSLSHYAAELAGFDILNGVYAYERIGGVARLTLSAQVQTAALEAMGDHRGTVAVFNYETGELLCAVTTPTFDPDNLPDVDSSEAYEGLYLNRFIQSEYVPGSIFKIVTLAAALESIPDIEEQTFTCTGSYAIGTDVVTCEGYHWDQTLGEAFTNSCNCAFAQIALQLGNEKLQEYVEKFALTESISFDGITTASGSYDVTDAAQVSLAWSAIGQYTDLVNPCVFLTFLGAIANDGTSVAPYLVEEIRVGDDLTYDAQRKTDGKILSEETAQALKGYMRANVAHKYGDQNFPGLTVCAKTGTAEVGGEHKPNAMLAGFVTDPQYPLAFIVAVEDGGYGSTTCIPIISEVLSECKAVLDGED